MRPRPELLPTFLVIGAQKSATSTLWGGLRRHPDVFVPEVKEPNYFATEDSYASRRSWYEGLFAGAGEASARGEASTTYSMFPHYAGTAARIAATLPEARLVYVVRDPVERMRSAYAHTVARGRETRPMAEALTLDLRYVSPGLYATQLDQYLRHFPVEQLLLVSQDDLRRDPDGVLHRVQAFIGVPPVRLPAPLEDLNVGSTKRAPRTLVRRWGGTAHPVLSRGLRPEELELPAALREQLLDLFRPDLERLLPLADASTAADLVRWRAG